MNFGKWKINVCKMKGLVVMPITHSSSEWFNFPEEPIVWEYMCGILKPPRRFHEFPMEFSVNASANHMTFQTMVGRSIVMYMVFMFDMLSCQVQLVNLHLWRLTTIVRPTPLALRVVISVILTLWKQCFMHGICLLGGFPWVTLSSGPFPVLNR